MKMTINVTPIGPSLESEVLLRFIIKKCHEIMGQNRENLPRIWTALALAAVSPDEEFYNQLKQIISSSASAEKILRMCNDIFLRSLNRFEKIERLFGSIPTKTLEMLEVPSEGSLEKVRETVLHVPRAKAHLAIGFKATTFSDPDRFALEVLNHVLGQEGRLFSQLRDKESLAFDVTSFFRPGMEPGVFGLYMACDGPKVDRAYEGLIREVELIKKGKVSDAELNRAVNNLIGNHLTSLQSSWARAEEIALYTLYGLGYDFDPVYIQKIREVKAEDVLRVARKYLDLEHCAIVKILPEGEEKPK